jgi:hypothetical protein
MFPSKEQVAKYLFFSQEYFKGRRDVRCDNDKDEIT